MKDIKIQYKDNHKEFQIEINDIDYKEDITFLEHLLEQFGVQTAETQPNTSSSEKEILSDVESKMLSVYSSYLNNDESKGLHSPDSEYTIPVVNDKKPIEYKPDTISNTTSIEEAFRKAQAAKESETSTVELPTKLDIERYQAYYICPNCGNKGKRHVRKTDKVIKCHNCPEVMTLREAHDDGFPQEDRFGNVFIAGTFVKDRHSKLN